MFASPWWLLLLLVAAGLVGGYLVVLRRRRRDVVRFTNLALLDQVAPRRPGWWRHLPAAALILAVAVLAVALAGPQAEAKVPRNRATVVLVIGVNGSGKTTTIGKLAHRLAELGQKVVIGAGDTFRAAAGEQLQIWAERSGAQLVRQAPGADPGAVTYDAIAAGKARGADVVIVDTAGRLQTQKNLMEELRKVANVAGKLDPEAPHETLLVLDATTGQNGISQAKLFNDAAPLTGVVLTKLDGIAKGGIVLSIQDQLGVPVKLVGVGEALEDLQPFDAESFARAIFAPPEV